MTEMIRKILQDLAPAAWRIETSEEETAELFFVKKQLDTRRLKDVSRCSVTIFRDSEEGERGFTKVLLTPGLSEGEIREKLEEGYYAASFVMNPYYEMPDPVQETVPPVQTPILLQPLGESAALMAGALLAGDDHPQAFLNSAEIFLTRTRNHILSSEGTDVSWSEGKVSGEFVCQCKEPEDVEMYESFSYDALEQAALTALVRETLAFTADRARAQKVLKSGQYDLILKGDHVREIFFYYSFRAAAHIIYPGYSSWSRGTQVQKAQAGYESLDLSLEATAPFSGEGIPMKDRVLLDMGILQTIPGPNRFCRYLNTEPTGEYRKLRCDNEGSRSWEELKKGPCLWVVNFSDFQMDPLSGFFGGEIRLAYLIEADGRVTPVTGGSVSASLLEKQDRLLLSRERYTSSRYEGPYGIRIQDVSVAGAEV